MKIRSAHVKRSNSSLLFVGAIIAVLILSTVPVFAHTDSNDPDHVHESGQQSQSDDTATTNSDDSEQSTETKRTSAQEKAKKAQEQREANKTKLEDRKLELCQKREKTVANIMARIIDRGAKRLQFITNVSDRTQAFYTQQGRVLANYDELLASVSSSKASAQSAVDAVAALKDSFNCESENPRGDADVFKAAVSEQVSALKTYREAVRNLMSGVKSVQPINEEGQQ